MKLKAEAQVPYDASHGPPSPSGRGNEGEGERSEFAGAWYRQSLGSLRAFSHTPDLSRWERETSPQRWTRCSTSADSIRNTEEVVFKAEALLESSEDRQP